jgi:hypothetical protein
MSQHPTQPNNNQHRGSDRPQLKMPGDSRPQPQATVAPAAPQPQATAAQTAPQTQATVAPPAPQTQPPKGRVWHPMTEAPKDGSYVYFKEDDNHDEWFWYETRQFRKGSWQQVGWWKRRFGITSQPSFVPTGFRRLAEGL